MAGEINLPSMSNIKAKIDSGISRIHPWHPEINLVPDVKNDMINALRLRNFTFFFCIVVASVSVAIILIFSSIAGGQQAIVDSKSNTIDTLAAKVNEYSNLNKFLTIKDQLNGLSEISSNKKVLSRIFNTLTALFPNGEDRIQISEISINLEGNSDLDLEGDPVTLSFDAQANAGTPPYYDYLLLESFKKSMEYMRYDYGEYEDKEGASIPAYCMIETDADGASFYDSAKGTYALWLIDGEGCNPSFTPKYDKDGNVLNATDATKGYESDIMTYDNQRVVRIWRTPQFSDWYSESPKSSEPYMSLNGDIENVAHFASSCITYAGIKNYQNTGNASEAVYATTKDDITWVGTNDCMLVDTSIDGGITVPTDDQSSARDSNGELVLRFSATIYLNPEVFNFNNKHLVALGPTGRFNVTDSYIQIKDMFAEAATKCEEDDVECNNNQPSQNGGN